MSTIDINRRQLEDAALNIDRQRFARAKRRSAANLITSVALRDFRLSGVALPPAEKEMFKQLSLRLSELHLAISASPTMRHPD